MNSRLLLIVGLAVAGASCAKSSQETDALAPPMKRDSSSMQANNRQDSTRIRTDSTRMQSDSVRRDTTSTSSNR